MLPKYMADYVREAVCDKGWPDMKSREMMMEEWADFNTKLKEPINPKYILNTSYIEPHWIKEARKELQKAVGGVITTDCKGCARLMTLNDPECKTCINQDHYKVRDGEIKIDIGFDVDIKKELNWLYGTGVADLGTIAYIQNDVDATMKVYETLKEREEKDMDNANRRQSVGIYNHRTGKYNKPEIEKVIFNDPATIVYWKNGAKTVVKCQEGDVYDPEKGLAMAIAKMMLGNQGNYCEVFKKFLPEKEEKVCSLKEMTGRATKALKKAGDAIASINKGCFNCKHEKNKATEPPCRECLTIGVKSKWEPKEGE